LDKNSLELHQAFFDINAALGGTASVIARVGRQEFYYGSQRLISTREGPNTRQSFDGLKFIITNDRVRTDVFYSHHVAVRKGIFNDRISDNPKLWGIYSVIGGVPVVQNIDLYYLGFQSLQMVFDDVSGKEMRHSFGTRLWNTVKHFKYDFEAVYQFGRIEHKSISAWTASLNTSYTFSTIKLHPRIGLKSELISGDKLSDDLKLQTFNPLFPRGGYFGLAALIGPENLVGFHPSIAVAPAAALNVSFDFDMLFRYSRYDGIYAPGNRLIYTGKSSRQKHIGNQYSFIVDYAPNRYLLFNVVLTLFDAGDYLKAVSPGKDVYFLALSAQAKF
jgi:hypothetical protein